MRAFWADTVSIAPLPRDEIITTEFQGRKLLIAFLIVESRRLGVVAQFKNLGYLDTDSSRNALNHLLDILAYDG